MEQQEIEFITSHQDSFSYYRNECIECMLSSGLWKDNTQAEKDLAEELSKGETYIIATQGNQVLGFVSGGPRRIQERRGEYELFHIGTNPYIRSKGVGKQLLEALVSHAKKHFIDKELYLRKFFLFTNIQNNGAHMFYEKNGMSCVGFSTHMFKNSSIELEYALIFDTEGNNISKEDPNLSLVIDIAKRLLQSSI